MQETVGMLELKIARLEHRLTDLEQRQMLSRPYPTYQANLTQEYLQLQAQLRQLIQRRHEVLQLASAAADRKQERI